MNEPTFSGMVTYHAGLADLMVDIDAVTQHPRNARAGDVEAVAESIEVNGMYRPIYVQRSTGHILAGNHTWEACKSLSARQIPVVYLDVDDTTAIRILLADNRTADLGGYDNAALLELLNEINATDSLLGTGYQPFDLDALTALNEVPVGFDEFGTWPSLCFQVPPTTKAAFLAMTEAAKGDRERFELLLRLAGWDGHVA